MERNKIPFGYKSINKLLQTDFCWLSRSQFLCATNACHTTNARYASNECYVSNKCYATLRVLRH